MVINLNMFPLPSVNTIIRFGLAKSRPVDSDEAVKQTMQHAKTHHVVTSGVQPPPKKDVEAWLASLRPPGLKQKLTTTVDRGFCYSKLSPGPDCSATATANFCWQQHGLGMKRTDSHVARPVFRLGPGLGVYTHTRSPAWLLAKSKSRWLAIIHTIPPLFSLAKCGCNVSLSRIQVMACVA